MSKRLSPTSAAASSLLLIGLSACPTATEPPEPGPPPELGPCEGELTWLQVADEEVAGANGGLDAERVWEFARFHTDAPARLCAVEAAIELGEAEAGELELWPDFGSDGVSIHWDAPLRVLSTEAAEDSVLEGWFRWDLSGDPLMMETPSYVFAGVFHDQAGDPLLAHDGSLSGVVPGEDVDLWAVNSIYWSNVPNVQGSPIGLSAGDYSVRLAVEYFNEVEDTAFAPAQQAEVGLGSGSRFAWADYDEDGDEDLMVAGPILYENMGDGTFFDVTEDAGLVAGSNGGVWGDFDNDGWPDYFATGGADVLWRNLGNGTFEDVTELSGIDDTQEHTCDGTTAVQHVPTEGAAWLDFDNDGYLDLYQANFICWTEGVGAQDRLWRNLGDGSFEDATVAAGVDMFGRAGRGVTVGDYDSDGWADILASNYRLHENYLFHNLGGSFEEVGEETGVEGNGVRQSFTTYYGHTIGSSMGDLDNDGDIDILTVNLAHPRFYSFSDTTLLFENAGGGSFVQHFEDVGLGYHETDSSPTLLDYDSDGLLDIFHTDIYPNRDSQLYRNLGGLQFAQSNYPSGLLVLDGWGNAASDFDGDGDMDLVTRDGIHENLGLSGNGSVMVRLHGAGAGATNTMAIGARVEATRGDEVLVREVDGGHGTGCQNGQWLHVGTAGEDEISMLAIFPSSSTVLDLGLVPAGSRLEVWEDGTVLD